MADNNTGQASPAAKAAYGTANQKAMGSDVGELQEKYRKAEAARERFVADWYLNSAFYIGQQWMMWNRGRLDKPQLAPWRATVVDNRILPVCWTRAARKVKNKPIFAVTPHSPDEDDIEASSIGEHVLESDWLQLELVRKLFRSQMQVEIIGASFWKIYWDRTLGKSEEFVFLPNGEPMTGPDGRPVRASQMQGMDMAEGYKTSQIAQGDICVEQNSPFEMYPDPLATSMDNIEWMIEKKVRSINYVREKFDYDPTPDTPAPLGPVESRSFPSFTYGGDQGDYMGVCVYEYWSKPSVEHPTGKYCVWANDQLLSEVDDPGDPMPYVMFQGLVVPNRFWPTAMTTQLRGPQVELNKVRSAIQESAVRIGSPALMRSRHANVTYTGLPGEIIEYDSTVPDAVPQYLQPPEVPNYVREEVSRILDSISEISGLHEVSKAQVPTGVTAASAINLLMEADDTRIGPEIADMERCLEQAGTKILQLRAKFNTDERLLALAGEEGNWDIRSFRGEMLKGNTDVEVQAGSAMPRSKAAKQAAMTELLTLAVQNGLPIDQRGLRKFFKDYEVGALDRLFEGLSDDEQQVQRENRQMAEGIPRTINDYDNDQYHIDAHSAFQKSQRYEQLDPGMQQLFVSHIAMHRQRAVALVDNQVAAQSQAQQGEAQGEMAHDYAQSAQDHQQKMEQQAQQGVQQTETAIAQAAAQAATQKQNGGDGAVSQGGG